MDITLIVLTVLQLCVGISFAVLAIKALLGRKDEVRVKTNPTSHSKKAVMGSGKGPS